MYKWVDDDVLWNLCKCKMQEAWIISGSVFWGIYYMIIIFFRMIQQKITGFLNQKLCVVWWWFVSRFIGAFLMMNSRRFETITDCYRFGNSLAVAWSTCHSYSDHSLKLNCSQYRLNRALIQWFFVACVASRPGQCGRSDGYVLEGKELEFYLRKIKSKRAKWEV